jgi:uncharacterized protein
MNRTFKTAVAALVLAIGIAGSVTAQPLDPAIAAAAADALADRKAINAYQAGDYATAIRLWRPLAEQGNSDAQGFLGDMYSKGQGVPQNYATAVSWLRKSAAQGDAIAQRDLEKMYLKGLTALSKDDYSTALQLIRPLAEQGDAAAQNYLGPVAGLHQPLNGGHLVRRQLRARSA